MYLSQTQKQVVKCNEVAYKNLRNAEISYIIVSSLIETIISSSHKTIQQNKFIKRSMKPYSSVKISSLLNQIGQLIVEESNQELKQSKNIETIAQEEKEDKGEAKFDLNQSLLQKSSTFTQNMSQKNGEHEHLTYFPKDNMYTNGVKIINIYKGTSSRDQQKSFKENMDSSHYNRSDRSNSFMTRSVIPNCNPVFRDTKRAETSQIQRQKLANNKHNQSFYKKSQHRSKSDHKSHLVNLTPQNNEKSRVSTFTSQEVQVQKSLEQQIQQLRIQKFIQQEQNRKNIQKQRKLLNLLNRDDMVLCFNYNGQFIKISKREYAQLIQKRGNQKLVENILQIEDNENNFWKTKNKLKSNKENKRKIPNNQSKGVNQFNQYNKVHSLNKNTDGTPNKMSDIKSKSPFLVDAISTNQKRKTSVKKIEQLKKHSIAITKKKNITEAEKVEHLNKSTPINRRHPQSTQNLASHNTSFEQQNLGKMTEQEIKNRENQIQFLNQKLVQFHKDQKNFMPEWYHKVEEGCKIKLYIKEQKNQDNNSKKKKVSFNRSSKEKFSKQNTINVLNQTSNDAKQIKSIQNLRNFEKSEKQLINQWEKRKNFVNIQVSAIESKKSGNIASKHRSHSVLQSYGISRSNTGNDKAHIKAINVIQQLQQKNQLFKVPSNSQLSQQQQKHENEELKQSRNGKKSQNSQTIKQKTNVNLTKSQFEIVKIFMQQKRKNLGRNKWIIENDDRKNSTSNNAKNAKSKQNNSSTNDEDHGFSRSPYQNIVPKAKAFSVIEKRSQMAASQAKRKLSGVIKISNEKLKSALIQYSDPTEVSRTSLLYNDQHFLSSHSQKLFIPSQSNHVTFIERESIKNNSSIMKSSKQIEAKIKKPQQFRGLKNTSILVAKPNKKIIRDLQYRNHINTQC